MENGALLLFTFFMISDPKTTPDSRTGRMLFAALVALGARYIQFQMFHTNSILWSLAACSLLVPLIDVLLPAERYSWTFAVDRSPLAVTPQIGQRTTANSQRLQGGPSWSTASQ